MRFAHSYLLIGVLLLTGCSADDVAEVSEENGVHSICICSRIYIPVCGSDGQTYGNPCELDCTKRRAAPDLQIAAYGRCGDPDELQSIYKEIPLLSKA
ncbi:hypothetical protein NQ318_003021 [Aromia moschata]|uniref:Kazal-like domain-containing protein n=1 Tax=Aromia moschata TaxID=1265417 RepID=A0AAV8YRN6_9CUCU|nr:hypothetical protein NQ318_003021 [Aromia moschata]